LKEGKRGRAGIEGKGGGTEAFSQIKTYHYTTALWREPGTIAEYLRTETDQQLLL